MVFLARKICFEALDCGVSIIPIRQDLGDRGNCGIENSRESRIFVTRIIGLHVILQADPADLS
jgi:hypothetical protein